MNQQMLALIAAGIVSSLAFNILPAEARGFRAAGARGAAGGFQRSGQYGSAAGIGGVAYGRGAAGLRGARWAGPNGGTYQGGGGGIVGRHAGILGGRFNAAGPNGGTANGGGLAAWKQGVGGYEQSHLNLKGPGGSTYNGSTQGKYNAQTGQGTYDASRQAYDAKNGQNYGYTDQTSYTKGQGGVSQIDTDHHGDYTVDWQKGAKPVVTQDN